MKLTPKQLRKLIKEEMSTMVPPSVSKDPQRFLHGFESGQPMDDEGYMIKSRMADVKEMAETICRLLDEGDQLPAWVQDLVASAHTDLEHVKDYLVGDEKLRGVKETYVRKPGQRVSDKEIMDRYGHMMGELSTSAGQDRVYKRLVMDTNSYDSADYVFDRMQSLSTQKKSVAESNVYRKGLMLEGHNRITPEEMTAWLQGDWSFVSEADMKKGGKGGGPRPPKPGDPEALAQYISRNPDFLGAAQEMDVEMKSDEMRQYVGDNLAGDFSKEDLDAAWAMLR